MRDVLLLRDIESNKKLAGSRRSIHKSEATFDDEEVYTIEDAAAADSKL